MDHEFGGKAKATPDTIGIISRHTDGVPTQIDRTLRDLEVVNPSELVNSDSEYVRIVTSRDNVSPALAKAINELATSDDPGSVRSYELLKVLSLFPQGEQLARVKRFNPTRAFHPPHATALLDQALIEVNNVKRLDTEESEAPGKTLLVPRIIRDIVKEKVAETEIRQLNRKATELYFGSGWTAGTYKPPPAYRFDRPHCASADIVNAGAILVRLIKDLIVLDDTQQLSRALGLANSYLRALIRGDHYRSAVLLCDDIIPIVPETGFDTQLTNLKAEYVNCLRMTGNDLKSISITAELDLQKFSILDQQDLLLDLALAYSSQKEDEEAKVIAEQVIRLDEHSSFALQARAIIIDLSPDDPARLSKLAKLEIRCRKEGATVVANNIALTRSAEAAGDADLVRKILAPVVKTNGGEKQDFYNRMRAALELAELALDNGERLNEKDLVYLVNAYHFLFNERLPGFFEECHDALWRSFEAAGDLGNLLTLFRFSSLYWRLRGREKTEQKYWRKLAATVGNQFSEKMSKLSREAAYFLVRAVSQDASPKSSPPQRIGIAEPPA
jgi:hypothetical protein